MRVHGAPTLCWTSEEGRPPPLPVLRPQALTWMEPRARGPFQLSFLCTYFPHQWCLRFPSRESFNGLSASPTWVQVPGLAHLAPGLSTQEASPSPPRQACLMPPPHRWCQCPAAGGNLPCAGATADRAASGRGERIHGQDRRAGKAAKPGPKGAGDPAGEAEGVGPPGVGWAPKNRPVGGSRLDTSLHPGKRMGLHARPTGGH